MSPKKPTPTPATPDRGKMRVLSIQIPSDLHKALRLKTVQNDDTIANVVRTLIHEYVERK